MKYKIDYVGFVENEEWSHHSWKITIGNEMFEYKTGSGHFTPYFNKGLTRNKKPININVIVNSKMNGWVHVPNINCVLDALFMDSAAGRESFEEFCDSSGYSSDSLKAFDIYRACMETHKKLLRALGSEYQSQLELIQNLRENGGL